MQVSDNLFLGSAITGITTNNNGGVGVGPLARIYVYNITPLTLQTNNYALAQSKAGAGSLTMTAGTGVTSGSDPYGTTWYVPDVPRTVRITSGANNSGRTITVSGSADNAGTPQTETITGPNGNTVEGKKAFYAIYGATISGATTSNVSLGTGDSFGLPFVLTDVNYVAAAKWASALANDTGTATKADATSPATATTGDVRGTYKPSSASNGSRRLTFAYYLDHTVSGPTATTAGALGVTPA